VLGFVDLLAVDAAALVVIGLAGVVLARAGVPGAILWIAGIGSRTAFARYSSHGRGAAIERFSIAHDITSAQAWVAALVLMALAEVIARLATIRLRAHQLPRAQVSTAQVAVEN
jgi:hypothetical protein